MPRPIPTVLIADDAAATRTFALVRRGDHGAPGLMVYEVLDGGEADPTAGTVVALPRGNGEAVLVETWGQPVLSDDLLLTDAERIAAALEEIEFRDGSKS